MKLILRLMLLVPVGLITAFQGNAATTINGGDVGDSTWVKAGSPYRVYGDITVAAGSTLKIEPGVTVAFAGNKGLTVNGQLLAQGTPGEEIVFTKLYPYANWLGLTFNATEDEEESVVEYASIRFGEKLKGGAVCIENGKVTLAHNTITDNAASSFSSNTYTHGGGIYIADGTVTLAHNRISLNTADYGGGVYIADGTVTLNDDTITSNAADYGVFIVKGTVLLDNNNISYNRGGIYATNSVVKINGNAIKNNSGNRYYQVGGGINISSSTASIYNNAISGNSATSGGGGIYVSNMTANIYGNLISNNKHTAASGSSGGGIFLRNSNSVIVNNTIVHNEAGNGNGIYCSNGSNPVVVNNILYGDSGSVKPQVYVADNSSAPKMRYNLNQCDCVDLAVGVSYNKTANYDSTNFNTDPLFVNDTLQNYRLRDTSPGVNAGLEDLTGFNLPGEDRDGNIRICDDRIDIGAYEYCGFEVNEIENTTAQQQPVAIFPNPSRDGLFQLKTDSNDFSWTVFDMTGKTVLQGNTQQIDLRAHEKGLYVIKILTDKTGYRMKLIKL